MYKKYRDLWLNGLRSGKYSQTRGTLERIVPDVDHENKEKPIGLCCLGVLCKVLGQERVEFDNLGIVKYLDPNWESQEDYPSEATKILINLDGKDINTLITLNDEYKQNFNAIADWIEKNIPEDVDPEIEPNPAISA